MPLHLLNKKKQAQIQIGESMLVIIFVLIIGVVALVFVSRMQEDKISVKLNEYESLNAVEIGHLVTNLFDLKCVEPGLTRSCVDLHKALAMRDIQQGDLAYPPAYDYYYELFKNSRITIEYAYPGDGTDDPIVLYYTNASDNQSTLTIYIPVGLYDATTDKTGFGMLVVERYRKVS